MAKQKRWGKKKIYARNWPVYNEEMVRRGMFYLDIEWVNSWDNEIIEMNKGKVGAQYQFPESLIKLQAVWLQLVDLRGVEGITRKVVEMGHIPKYNDFSTISRRVNAMSTNLELPDCKEIHVSTDLSGMKMNMSGEYFHSMYGKVRKKFIKVTISADPFTKDLLALDVSLEGEDLSETDVAMTHMAELEAQGCKVLCFWGDGKYDTHELFDFMDFYGIKSAVKIRKNAVVDPGGSVRRNIEVAKYKKLGYKKWAKQRKYGQRWVGTEGIFSAVKRKFGERTRSKKEDTMIRETKRKFWAYESIRKYAMA